MTCLDLGNYRGGSSETSAVDDNLYIGIIIALLVLSLCLVVVLTVRARRQKKQEVIMSDTSMMMISGMAHGRNTAMSNGSDWWDTNDGQKANYLDTHHYPSEDMMNDGTADPTWAQTIGALTGSGAQQPEDYIDLGAPQAGGGIQRPRAGTYLGPVSPTGFSPNLRPRGGTYDSPRPRSDTYAAEDPTQVGFDPRQPSINAILGTAKHQDNYLTLPNRQRGGMTLTDDAKHPIKKKGGANPVVEDRPHFYPQW